MRIDHRPIRLNKTQTKMMIELQKVVRKMNFPISTNKTHRTSSKERWILKKNLEVEK